MKKIIKSNSLIWAFIKSALFLILLSAIYAFIFLFNYNEVQSFFLAYIIFTGCLISKNKEIFKEDFTNFKKIKYKEIIRTLIIALIFTTLSILANQILIKILGHTAANETNNISSLNKSGIIAYLNVLLFAPIAEELVFRYPYRNVSGHKFPVFIFYALMFALAHISLTDISDYIFLIPYMLTSLGISYTYYKTNNIYVSIMYHILNNLIAVMLLLI